MTDLTLYDANDVAAEVEAKALLEQGRFGLCLVGLASLGATDVGARLAASMMWLGHRLVSDGCDKPTARAILKVMPLRSAQMGAYKAAAYLHAMWAAADPEVYTPDLREEILDSLTAAIKTEPTYAHR